MNNKDIISILNEINEEILDIEMKFFERYGRYDNYTQKIRKNRIRLDKLIEKINEGETEK